MADRPNAAIAALRSFLLVLKIILAAFKTLLARFTVLFGAVRELWIVFAYVVMSNVAYMLVVLTLSLWLSADLGYDDFTAGWWVTTWTAGMTLCVVLVGSLTDALGLRKTFLLGCALCLLSRLFMTFAIAKVLVLGGLMVLALGEALGTPVTVAALRRYTTTAQRSIAFSIFYALMNVGYGLAGYVFDFVRQTFGEHGHLMLPGLVSGLSSYRTIFLVSIGFYVPCLLMVYFWLREGVEATDQGVMIAATRIQFPGTSMFQALGLNIRDTLRNTGRIFIGLWRQPGFYKFLAFLSLAAFIKMIFTHMYFTYPKFGIRELGEGAPIGRLWSMNNFLIVFLAPLVGVLSQRISAYSMAMWGSLVAASSVFIMALPPPWFQPLADGWLGHSIAHVWLGVQGHVNPYYVMIFLYVLCLSVGEAIYSPRLYEYAAAIAPKGQEASYMALSSLPFFLAKLCMAPLSGVLLARFCPAQGPRHSETLWLIIALTTMVAPVGLFVFQRLIRIHEAGRGE
jgi:MFS family permease